MLKIYPKANSGISLGRSGEKNARQICFDISGWRELYGEGVVQLLHQRPSDADPYPVEVTVDGSAVLWTVTLADTSEPGHGKAELQYRVGDTVAKSVAWATFVGTSLGTPTDTPPEAQQGWVDKVLAAGANAENAAQRAEEAAEKAEDAGVSDADVAKAVADYLAENPVNAEVSQEQIEEAVRDYILENPIEGGVTDEQIAAAVEDYLTKNPIDGGITEETDPTVPDWAKTALTAEVGQYLRVSAVDDNGVVTAVETVDAPSGGGEVWELISSGEVTEETNWIAITTDDSGKEFRLKMAEISVSTAATESNTSDSTAAVRINSPTAAKGGFASNIPRAFRANASNGFGGIILAYNKYIWGAFQSSAGSGSGWNGNNLFDGTIAQFYLTGGVFGVGSTWEIWGVRA